MLDRTAQQIWSPDYKREMLARSARADILLEGLETAAAGRAYYRTRPIEFIEHWCYTFDPRNAGTERPTKIPFILFPRQRELIEFLHACLRSETSGLVEKSRDMGATWLAAVFSVWLFLFEPGATIGWGSRKAASVDQIGDMSSIFEKMRWMLRSTPPVFWPPGFDPNTSMSYMRIYSDHSSITGESGDDIGRGGRTLIYFKDESAHYEHPEAIEAALSDNTRVQIDISSVNGLGNVFHRKREGGVEWEPGTPATRGKTNVFIMDWSDHPDKTQAWYDERRNLAVDAGLLHVFAQEVDRNYSAAVEGVVIPAEWVRSAIDAHVKLGWDAQDNDPSARSSSPTTATTRAPRARPSWTAAMPLPPAAPRTASQSPAFRPPRSTSPIHPVRCGIQNPAAWTAVRPAGTSKAVSAATRHSSANDPLPSRNEATPMMRVPIGVSTPSPTAVTVPVASWPGMNGIGGVSG